MDIEKKKLLKKRCITVLKTVAACVVSYVLLCIADSKNHDNKKS